VSQPTAEQLQRAHAWCERHVFPLAASLVAQNLADLEEHRKVTVNDATLATVAAKALQGLSNILRERHGSVGCV
jgi:hypothetical protein